MAGYLTLPCEYTISHMNARRHFEQVCWQTWNEGGVFLELLKTNYIKFNACYKNKPHFLFHISMILHPATQHGIRGRGCHAGRLVKYHGKYTTTMWLCLNIYYTIVIIFLKKLIEPLWWNTSTSRPASSIFQGFCFYVDTVWSIHRERSKNQFKRIPLVTEQIVFCIMKRWLETEEGNMLIASVCDYVDSRWLIPIATIHVCLCAKSVYSPCYYFTVVFDYGSTWFKVIVAIEYIVM